MELKDIPGILVARMDIAENDFEGIRDVLETVPSFIIYPRGENKVLVKYVSEEVTAKNA